MRTEVFKRQIDEMAKVLQMFIGKGEVALSEEFDMKELFQANVAAMYDKYALFAFNAHPANEDDVPYAHAKCPASLVKPEFLMLADEYIQPSKKDYESTPVEDKEWRYRHAEIHLTRKSIEHNERVRTLLANPLLPSELCVHIKALLDVAGKNSHLLSDVIEWAALQMPDKYPNFDDLSQASFNWIHAEYIRKADNFEVHADAISTFIREYFATDRLLERSKRSVLLEGSTNSVKSRFKRKRSVA
jgi:hypothetical protein